MHAAKPASATHSRRYIPLYSLASDHAPMQPSPASATVHTHAAYRAMHQTTPPCSQALRQPQTRRYIPSYASDHTLRRARPPPPPQHPRLHPPGTQNPALDHTLQRGHTPTIVNDEIMDYSPWFLSNCWKKSWTVHERWSIKIWKSPRLSSIFGLVPLAVNHLPAPAVNHLPVTPALQLTTYLLRLTDCLWRGKSLPTTYSTETRQTN